MSGKGSKPRPLSVTQQKFNEAFDRIFQSSKCADCGKSIASGHIHTCSPQVKDVK